MTRARRGSSSGRGCAKQRFLQPESTFFEGCLLRCSDPPFEAGYRSVLFHPGLPGW
jgi:hypothetical protein